jgi:hypothetical protein
MDKGCHVVEGRFDPDFARGSAEVMVGAFSVGLLEIGYGCGAQTVLVENSSRMISREQFIPSNAMAR